MFIAHLSYTGGKRAYHGSTAGVSARLIDANGTFGAHPIAKAISSVDLGM